MDLPGNAVIAPKPSQSDPRSSEPGPQEARPGGAVGRDADGGPGAGQAPDPLEALLDRAFRYALALTHDESRAEDLVQDAALAILKRGAPRSAGYLFTTIRNRFIDEFRRSRRIQMQPLLDDDAPPALTLVGEPDEIVDSERLHAALGELGAYEREVVFLAYVEGHTAQEIADLMVSPRGTILSLMHRARKKLLAILGEENS